jgi:hypothetical protein
MAPISMAVVAIVGAATALERYEEAKAGVVRYLECMAEHVRMDWKLQSCGDACPGDHLPHRGIRQRPLPFPGEDVG